MTLIWFTPLTCKYILYIYDIYMIRYESYLCTYNITQQFVSVSLFWIEEKGIKSKLRF